jgi:hypothetical protein
MFGTLPSEHRIGRESVANSLPKFHLSGLMEIRLPCLLNRAVELIPRPTYTQEAETNRQLRSTEHNVRRDFSTQQFS